MKKQKTIFMTGATGFVGSHLACALLGRGHRLMLLVRGEDARERADRALRGLYEYPENYEKAKDRVEIIGGDITVKDLGISARHQDAMRHEVDEVFHCAASVSFDEAKKETIEGQNVAGTVNVLECMRGLDLHRLHYISTAYVAGQRTGVVYEDELDAQQSFNNPYEASKCAAEKLVRSREDEYGILSTVYRPSIVVGDSRSGKTTSFSGFYGYVRALDLLVRIAKKGLDNGRAESGPERVHCQEGLLHVPLRVRGLPVKTLNLLPIDHAVDVIMRIYECAAGHGKTYHIIDPHPQTIEGIQRAISDALRVAGVGFVHPSAFPAGSMNRWEKFFARSTKNFAPYLCREEAVFSAANTQKVLQGTGIACPGVTADVISKSISCCIATDWGRAIPPERS